MKISEIQEEENRNPGHIMLRREGMFWRAYELSAYLFVTQLKEYAATYKSQHKL